MRRTRRRVKRDESGNSITSQEVMRWTRRQLRSAAVRCRSTIAQNRAGWRLRHNCPKTDAKKLLRIRRPEIRSIVDASHAARVFETNASCHGLSSDLRSMERTTILQDSSELSCNTSAWFKAGLFEHARRRHIWLVDGREQNRERCVLRGVLDQ